MTAKVSVVVGLGFGDEGKGTTTEHLTYISKQPVTVVRYSGGAQCAHNVVLPDRTHHTFKQFGSGTFHGAKTHLSRHMLVNPLSLEREAEVLMQKGVTAPWSLLTVDNSALVTNVYQIAANRIREICRGEGRHGSCGMGIGETVADALDHPEDVLRVQDLHNGDLERKLDVSRRRKLESLPEDYAKHIPEDHTYLQILKGDAFSGYVRAYSRVGERLSNQMVSSDYLQNLQRQDAHLIFEGAQGVLLDQDYGFFPHVTRSKTTLDNALDLLEEGTEYTTYGVLRSYMTRHGAGPLPTENLGKELPDDVHNTEGEYQGKWRTGPLDLVLLKYAVDVLGGVDRLVLTHMDSVPFTPQICSSYYDLELSHSPTVDLGRQELLTSRLRHAAPVLEELGGLFSLVYRIQLALEAPVQWCSFGPTHQHKMPPEIYLRKR